MSMFKAINDLIIKYTSYPDDIIFKNYYNNATLPKDNKFCTMAELYTRPMATLPPNIIKIVEDNAEIDIKQLNKTYFQVDFYGNESSNDASQLAVVLQSRLGTEFLKERGYTVSDSESPQQLTMGMDRSNYILRYCVRFSLFNNTAVKDIIEAFNQVNIKTTLVETIK